MQCKYFTQYLKVKSFLKEICAQKHVFLLLESSLKLEKMICNSLRLVTFKIYSFYYILVKMLSNHLYSLKCFLLNMKI